MKSFVLQNIETYVIYIFISVGGSTNIAKSLLYEIVECKCIIFTYYNLFWKYSYCKCIFL